MISKSIFIYGKVQGVSFRASLKEEAEQLSVTGWVRNRKEGSVEALIQSKNPEALDSLMKWCQKGPSRSQVEKIEFQNSQKTEVYSDFEIIETA